MVLFCIKRNVTHYIYHMHKLRKELVSRKFLRNNNNNSCLESFFYTSLLLNFICNITILYHLEPGDSGTFKF